MSLDILRQSHSAKLIKTLSKVATYRFVYRVPDVRVIWLPVDPSDYDSRYLTYLQISSPTNLRSIRSFDFGNITFWNSLPFKEPGSKCECNNLG